MKAASSGRMVKELINEGDLDFEGVDVAKALLYLQMNRDKLAQKDLKELGDYLPERKYQGSKEPGMAGPRVRWPRKVGEVSEKEDNWIHKSQPRGASWRRKIVGMMAQVGIQVAFQNYCYTFGGKLYHQLKGDP